MSKYGSRRTVVHGQVFDSAKEAQRYCELLLMQKAGEIKHLERQPEYTLIPVQKRDGNVVERAVKYRADFFYVDTATGEEVVEDVKGMRTKEYIIKRKLMLWELGIMVKEV